MKPELKKRLDAALARKRENEAKLAALAAKAANPTAADGTVTTGVTSPELAADVSRRIEVLERTVKSYEAEGRNRVVGASETKAFTPKVVDADEMKVGIDGNRFSIVKALLARHDFDRLGRKAFETNSAEYERDALDAYYKAYQKVTGKTMTFGDESNGGFLVPPEVRSPIDALRSATWMDKLPVQKYSNLTYSPVYIPRQTADNTSYWLTEGTATTTSDPALDQIALNPSILANGTKLSLHLMRKAPATAETIARRSIAASMDRKKELGIIEGASGGPLGLKNVTGIGAVDFTSATGDTKQTLIKQMILELVQDNVPTPGAMFLMSEKVWMNFYNVLLTYSTFTSTANRAASGPMGSLAWVDPQGRKWLAGYEVVTTNNLTVSMTGELYFGQWPNLIVGDWGAAEMKMTTEGSTLTLARQALIATFQEVGMAVEHPEAFSRGHTFTVALS